VLTHGDPECNANNRPSLYISPARAIDLGNGFADLHPSMAPTMAIYDHPDLTGTDGLGNLAIIYPVGYAGQSKSHFDSQHYWETDMPGDPSVEEGMIYRQVAQTMNPIENSLVAAAMSSSQMLAFRGQSSRARTGHSELRSGRSGQSGRLRVSQNPSGCLTENSRLASRRNGPTSEFIGWQYHCLLSILKVCADGIQLILRRI
jgi:uncharacterized protein (DUF1501 family)